MQKTIDQLLKEKTGSKYIVRMIRDYNLFNMGYSSEKSRQDDLQKRYEQFYWDYSCMLCSLLEVYTWYMRYLHQRKDVDTLYIECKEDFDRINNYKNKYNSNIVNNKIFKEDITTAYEIRDIILQRYSLQSFRDIRYKMNILIEKLYINNKHGIYTYEKRNLDKYNKYLKNKKLKKKYLKNKNLKYKLKHLHS